MPDPLETPQQVRQYLATALNSSRQFRVLPTQFGWACREVLTQEEIQSGQAMGLGSYVVNRQTAAITAHTSMPLEVIAQEYDQAIQTGRQVQGYQVYPPTWNVEARLIGETPEEIVYRVQATSPTDPPAGPPIDHQLMINKATRRYRTNVTVIHEACRQTAGWAITQHNQWGTWPESRTYQF
ncbi:hypothetical protein [Nocardia sp. NPDC019395]|uniref:hypothetical protein n=1 Tax=Nocardia sp. NPDC019395 TaxID=3154686 RepID=UPI0033D0A578